MNTYKYICPNTFISNTRFYVFSILACVTIVFSSCSENAILDENESATEKEIFTEENPGYLSELQLNEFLNVVNGEENAREEYTLKFDDLENYIETALNYSFGDMRKLSKKTKLIKGNISLSYKSEYGAKKLKELYTRTLSTLRGHKRDVPFKVDFVNYIDIEVDQESTGYTLNYAIRLGEEESQDRTPSRWEFTISELDAYNGDCDGNSIPGYEDTPQEIADRATHNVNIPWTSGPCCYYTVNIESDEFSSADNDPYGFVDMWDITCTHGSCMCASNWWLCDCEYYIFPVSIDNGLQLNSNGIEHWCLNTTELNHELTLAENAGENWANEVNKEIIGFDISMDYLLCPYNTNKFYSIHPTRANRGIIFNPNQGTF